MKFPPISAVVVAFHPVLTASNYQLNPCFDKTSPVTCRFILKVFLGVEVSEFLTDAEEL